MISLIIKLLIVLILAAIAFGVYRTLEIEHSVAQDLFIGGKLPNPTPDGLYNATLPGRKVSWLGKKFNSANSTGINVFDNGKDVLLTNTLLLPVSERDCVTRTKMSLKLITILEETLFGYV